MVNLSIKRKLIWAVVLGLMFMLIPILQALAIETSPTATNNATQTPTSGVTVPAKSRSTTLLDVCCTKLTLGKQATLSGRVSGGKAGDPVRLVVFKDGKSFKVFNLKLDKNARFSHIYTPPAAGMYEMMARFLGNSRYLQSQSRWAKIAISPDITSNNNTATNNNNTHYYYYAPPHNNSTPQNKPVLGSRANPASKRKMRASLSLSSTRVRLRRAEILSGTVSDPHPGKIMTLIIKRGNRGRATIVNVRLDSNSRYRYVYVPSTRGKYYAIAKFTGDACHHACISRQRTFTVR